MSKIDKKGCFSSKMANNDSKYDTFIHFTTKFNSKDYSITFFLENSIKKLMQKLEFGCIQFNKIFIQEDNQGIAHPYFGRLLSKLGMDVFHLYLQIVLSSNIVERFSYQWNVALLEVVAFSLLCQPPVVLNDQVDNGGLCKGARVPQVAGLPGSHLPQDPPHNLP